MKPANIVFNLNKFMNDLKTPAKSLNQRLKKDLQSQMATELNSKISSQKAKVDKQTLEAFKKQVKVSSSYIGTTPDAIYKVLIENMSDEILASDYFKLEDDLDDDPEKLTDFLAKVANYIYKILDKKKTVVTVDNKKYQVEFPFGTTVTMATVTDLSNDKSYSLTWKDTGATLKTLTNFMSDLIAYEKSSAHTIVKKYLMDVINIAVDDYIDYLSNHDIVTKNVSDFLKDKLAEYKNDLESIGQSIDSIKEFFKEFFPKTDSELTQIQKNYQSFVKYESELEKAISKLTSPDPDTIKNLNAYKNFLSAYETLSGTTLNISPEDYVTYYFNDVHNAIITETRASIVGTNEIDSIISEGKNSTLYGENGNDSLMIEGDYSEVYGGAGDDKIIVTGAYSKAYGDEGNDAIVVTGDSSKIYGGYGQDFISVKSSNITVTGDSDTFDYLPISDIFIIANSARNVLITDFDKSSDKLQLNFSDIVVDLEFVDGDQSLVILTADKYEKVVVLKGVSESSFNNVAYNGTTTSIDWLLQNKKFTIKNPYEDLEKKVNVNNDTIENTLSGVMIEAVSGNKTISNSGNNVKINCGTGNDYVQNYGDDVTINGGQGDDTIYNDDPGDLSAGLNVVVNAGSGNDVIFNDNSGAMISGGDGNDNITNYGTNVSISGGLGNDVIINPIYATGNGESVTIDAGEGADKVKNYSSKVTVNAGGGNDSIYNEGSFVIIEGVMGCDTIKNFGSNVKIYGGSDSDKIYSVASNITINGGDSNDYIENGALFNLLNDCVIIGGNGNDTIYNTSVENTTIDGGEDNDYIANGSANTSINGGTGNDFIENYGSSVTIEGYDGNNSIISEGNNSKVYSGVGDDSIRNKSNNTTIYGGNGKDTIENILYFNEVYGDEGDDSIKNIGDYSTLNGGAGDDYIRNRSSDTTIYGGKGNDYIDLGFYPDDSKKNILIYSNWDGYDTVYGFKYNDILQIVSGDYNTVENGNDVIVKVGSGSIKLIDQRNRKLNIQGTLSTDTVSTVETAKNISNTISNTIISGTKYADTLSNSADGVTINGGADNDYIQNSGNNVTIIGGEGKDTIVVANSNLTLPDFSSEDVISLIDSIKSIRFDENSKTLNLDDKFVISLPNINVIKSNWTTSDNSVTYTPAQLPEVTLAKNGKSITVAEGKATTPVTVSGLKNGLKVKDDSVSGIILNDNTFTISDSVLDKKTVTVSTGYTLALANDVSTPIKSAASWSVDNGTATYKDGNTSAGYSISNGKIVYSDAIKGAVLTTITGLKSDATVDGIKLSGKTVTLSASVLDKKDVTITNGYSLALADDVAKPVTDNITCNVTNGTVTYKGDKSAGYSSAGGKIAYSEKSTDETLTTINGLKNDATESAVSLKDDTLNISKSAIGNEPVTVNATDDVAKVVVEGAGNFVFGEHIFKVETPANFNLNTDGAVTSYQIESAGRLTNAVAKVSVIGSSGNDTISNTGDNVHVSESAGFNNLTNSGAKVTVIGAKGNDTVNNSGEGSLINTGDGADSITNSGNNVTISSGAGDDKISVTDKASNVTINVSEGRNTVDNHGSLSVINAGKDVDNITNNGSNVTITAASGNDKVTNSGAKVSISGGEGNDTISNTGAHVTISGDAGTDVISLSGSSQNVTVSGGKNNDTIYSNGNSNIFRYSAGDGDDVIFNLGNNDTVQVASGNVDSVYAEKGGDVIVKVGSSNIRLKNKAGQTINVKNASGNITSQSYAYTEPTKPSTPTPTPSTPSSPSTPSTPSPPSTNTPTKTSTTTPSTKPSSSSSGSSSNNSSSSHSSNSSSINGSSSSSSTRSSSNSSSLSGWSSSPSNSNNNTWGSNSSSTRSSTSNHSSSYGNSSNSNGSTIKQNPTTPSITSTPIEKTTMAKSDGTTAIMYNYTGGHRTVANYSPEEKIQLSSDFAGIDVSHNNFVIKSSSGSLTIKDVRDKVIDVAGTDGNTAAYVYMFSGEGFIDGTIADKYEVIVGSENAMNHLKAGNFGSSLIGGGGYTTLTSGASDDFMQGGTSQDTFFYTGGNDVISNYQSGEQVNFAATYTGWTTEGNNLVITAAEGSVRINDSPNKLIEVGDANGNLLAHVYQADGYGGIIDGRGFGAFEVIVGSDNISNQIFSDSAGSSLWGGRGNSNDDLYGNTGIDEYIYSYRNGNDNVFQAGNEDTVNLLNISLEQIASAEITDNGVIARFTDGSSLNINGQAGSFKLGSQTFHADYQNKIWS